MTPVALLATIALTVLVARSGLPGGTNESTSVVPTHTSTPVTSGPPLLSATSSSSVFELASDDINEFGRAAVKGYAFVVRTDGGTSDLLTDYQLVVDDYLKGITKIVLQHGDQAFTANVVVASADPHVALLKIQGTWPPLGVATTQPKIGDTVTVGPYPPEASVHAAVIHYAGRGGSSHLTFSVEVPTSDAGSPVRNASGDAVGVAEPSAPFSAPGVGFAVPISAACAAVGGC